MSNLGHCKTQTLRHSINAPAASQQSSLLTKPQTYLTLAQRHRPIQRTLYSTNVDQTAHNEYDRAGKSAPPSKEEYLSKITFSQCTYYCY